MAQARAARLWCWIALAAVALPAAGARAAVLRSFDQVFEGDDPSEVFEFNLPFDQATPAVVRFDGFAENLDAGAEAETGVRFQLRWRPATGDGGGVDLPDETLFPRGVRLPPADPTTGPARVPIEFESLVPYSPALLLFAVEGLGPSDHFRFAGELSIRPVPEPGAPGLALLASSAALGFSRCRARVRGGSTCKLRPYVPASAINRATWAESR